MSDLPSPPGCDRCRGSVLVSGGPTLRRLIDSPTATLFRCRACSTLWVDAFGQYPRAVTTAEARRGFPDWEEERPDDGAPWLA